MSSFTTTNRPDGAPVPVTADNFRRAESDLYFHRAVKDGGFAKFHHFRAPVPVENQPVVRINRDTLYSTAVFDLDAGPVTVTLPDSGQRFMSMQVFDEDEYVVEVVYGGRHTYDADKVGTRYTLIAIRTLVNPDDPADLKQVHALQDAIKVEQRNAGQFEMPAWDATSQAKVRQALMVLAETIPDSKGMFGGRSEVDAVRHLVGVATGWGGNPEKDATYQSITPAKNDGRTVHRLTVRDVPVDGFWSITVYNKDGYLEPNPQNAYSLNGITAKRDADGGVTVQFGGCDGTAANCLPIMAGWNCWVRLYRPRAEILNGTWKFPEIEPV